MLVSSKKIAVGLRALNGVVVLGSSKLQVTVHDSHPPPLVERKVIDAGGSFSLKRCGWKKMPNSRAKFLSEGKWHK